MAQALEMYIQKLAGLNGEAGIRRVFGGIDLDDTERVLYRFTGGSDGANPVAGLIADASGNLYGTTEFGGRRQRLLPNGGDLAG
jgi:hypothetical protein